MGVTRGQNFRGAAKFQSALGADNPRYATDEYVISLLIVIMYKYCNNETPFITHRVFSISLCIDLDTEKTEANVKQFITQTLFLRDGLMARLKARYLTAGFEVRHRGVNAPNPLRTFPRNFPVDATCYGHVADLLATRPTSPQQVGNKSFFVPSPHHYAANSQS